MAGRYFNPSKEETEEISRDPYVSNLVKRVKKFAYMHCASHNLYAWREFIDDLQADLELFIYDYELAHKKGLYKKSGYGAYCNAATQQAKNWIAYYSAQKRKINNETISIEESEEDEAREAIQVAIEDKGIEQFLTLTAIGQEFGEATKELCEKLLNGEVVNRADLNGLKKLKSLRDFLGS